VNNATAAGAVSIALVLSLPKSNYRDLIAAMTFGVALISLIVQPEILNAFVKRESQEQAL
jgi:NhaP-type Na+/H+ or K+/H+ antiporter